MTTITFESGDTLEVDDRMTPAEALEYAEYRGIRMSQTERNEFTTADMNLLERMNYSMERTVSPIIQELEELNQQLSKRSKGIKENFKKSLDPEATVAEDALGTFQSVGHTAGAVGDMVGSVVSQAIPEEAVESIATWISNSETGQWFAKNYNKLKDKLSDEQQETVGAAFNMLNLTVAPKGVRKKQWDLKADEIKRKRLYKRTGEAETPNTKRLRIQKTGNKNSLYFEKYDKKYMDDLLEVDPNLWSYHPAKTSNILYNKSFEHGRKIQQHLLENPANISKKHINKTLNNVKDEFTKFHEIKLTGNSDLAKQINKVNKVFKSKMEALGNKKEITNSDLFKIRKAIDDQLGDIGEPLIEKYHNALRRETNKLINEATTGMDVLDELRKQHHYIKGSRAAADKAVTYRHPISEAFNRHPMVMGSLATGGAFGGFLNPSVGLPALGLGATLYGGYSQLPRLYKGASNTLQMGTSMPGRMGLFYQPESLLDEPIP